jgi:hypothetical protein
VIPSYEKSAPAYGRDGQNSRMISVPTRSRLLSQVDRWIDRCARLAIRPHPSLIALNKDLHHQAKEIGIAHMTPHAAWKEALGNRPVPAPANPERGPSPSARFRAAEKPPSPDNSTGIG